MPSPGPSSAALPARPGTPRAHGRLESSFSVEAILARPGPQPQTASQPPVSTCAAPGPWIAALRPPYPVLPWVCPATWLPAYVRMGFYPLCPQPTPSGLHFAHFCGGLPGVSVAGSGLAHCSVPWAPSDWAPTQDLQAIEGHQKRYRTMFNLEQLEELEKAFAKQHNLVGKKRAQLAARLHLTENQVRIWFQNRRVKYQKQQKLKSPALCAAAASLDEPSSSSDGSSIPGEDPSQ
ncbi:homeobox protein notochord [Ctenodactylus gundi]